MAFKRWWGHSLPWAALLLSRKIVAFRLENITISSYRVKENVTSFTNLSQYTILSTFFNSTSKNSKWLNETEDVCEWSGIRCNTEGHVVSILLNRANLTGSIPSIISELPHLKDLVLSRNSLSGSIPWELGNMYRSLENIVMFGNRLSGTIPAAIGGLSNLINLDLTDNNIHGTLPWEIGLLKKLKYMYLDDNKISGSIPIEFGYMSSLKRIFVNNNNLEGSIPYDLENLPNLESLWCIAGNNLRPPAPKFLCQSREVSFDGYLRPEFCLQEGDAKKPIAILLSIFILTMGSFMIMVVIYTGNDPSRIGPSLEFSDIAQGIANARRIIERVRQACALSIEDRRTVYEKILVRTSFGESPAKDSEVSLFRNKNKSNEEFPPGAGLILDASHHSRNDGILMTEIPQSSSKEQSMEEKSETAEDTCVICLENFERGDEVFHSRYCEHIYHADCICEWLERDTACPCCRVEMVTLDDIEEAMGEFEKERKDASSGELDSRITESLPGAVVLNSSESESINEVMSGGESSPRSVEVFFPPMASGLGPLGWPHCPVR